MNTELQKFARTTLKDELSKCTEAQQLIFKRMYIPWALEIINENRRLTEEELAMPINDLVDKMPEDKLDWAMQQVQRTLDNGNTTAQA